MTKPRCKKKREIAPPPPPSMLVPVTAGTRWRLRFYLERAHKSPPTFKTLQIVPGGRYGTVEVLIEAVCASGCHATVKLPTGELFEAESAKLLLA